MDIFSLNYHFSFLSPSLWETSRYRLKYCLKGPLNPEQPTNQLSLSLWKTARYRLKYCLKGPLNPKQPTNQLCQDKLVCRIIWVSCQEKLFRPTWVPYNLMFRQIFTNFYLETRKRVIDKQCRPRSDPPNMVSDQGLQC